MENDAVSLAGTFPHHHQHQRLWWSDNNYSLDMWQDSDSSLESAFSSLNLSAPPSDPCLDALVRYDVRDSINDQIDFGGGAHGGIYNNINNRSINSPTTGMVPGWTYPTAAISPYDLDYDYSSLLLKQQQQLMIGNDYILPPKSPVPRRRIPTLDQDRYVRPRPLDQPHVPLKYLRGSIVNLAKNQRGCRVLQGNLENPTEDEIDWVLSEVLYHIDELMCDQFGNYVFQKLVKVANERQRTQIVLSLCASPIRLVNVCLSPHGTRAVQKLLEYVNNQHQISFVMTALLPGAVTLSTDPNGHHVIQHCLKRFSFEDNKYLINEMTAQCFEISTNRSGCCVMQTCVDFSRGDFRKRLTSEIIANAVHLAEDPYGNYVVQHLLDIKSHEVTEELLRQLEGFNVALSCNKYASNVVQKCMEVTEDEHSSRVIMECLRSPHFSRLLNDPYGNYVIQTALRRFKGPVLKNLLNMVRPNAASMRNNMYGKKILDLCHEMKLWRVV